MSGSPLKEENKHSARPEPGNLGEDTPAAKDLKGLPGAWVSRGRIARLRRRPAGNPLLCSRAHDFRKEWVMPRAGLALPALLLSLIFAGSSSHGVFEAYAGESVDFMTGNSFEGVAGCFQVMPKSVDGRCPDPPPCASSVGFPLVVPDDGSYHIALAPEAYLLEDPPPVSVDCGLGAAHQRGSVHRGQAEDATPEGLRFPVAQAVSASEGVDEGSDVPRRWPTVLDGAHQRFAAQRLRKRDGAVEPKVEHRVGLEVAAHDPDAGAGMLLLDGWKQVGAETVEQLQVEKDDIKLRPHAQGGPALAARSRRRNGVATLLQREHPPPRDRSVVVDDEHASDESS
jgi:hypothetical protein